LRWEEVKERERGDVKMKGKAWGSIKVDRVKNDVCTKVVSSMRVD
jgi:hypothetical protein